LTKAVSSEGVIIVGWLIVYCAKILVFAGSLATMTYLCAITTNPNPFNLFPL